MLDQRGPNTFFDRGWLALNWHICMGLVRLIKDIGPTTWNYIELKSRMKLRHCICQFHANNSANIMPTLVK